MQITESMLRYLYQTNLTAFIQLTFSILHPDRQYHHHWPIDLIGQTLQRCHEGKIRRLIINLPPRYLKSLCVSVAFPAWVLGQAPQTKIMCVTGHRGLVNDQHAMARTLMMHPQYHNLFPHIRVESSNQCLRTMHGGMRSAFTATPSGGITGRGADMILIDDPLGASEVEDEEKIEKLNRWYDQNIYQRLDCKDRGVIILVMQRLHIDDLTAHLLKQDGWEHINLPAIATDDEFTSTFGLPGNRLLRKKGEALHPAVEDRDTLRNAMLRMKARAFMAQYQQCPYPPGEGGEIHGVFHMAPHKEATWDEYADVGWFFASVDSETFVLDELFGERTCLRRGNSRETPRTNEEWVDYINNWEPELDSSAN